MKDEDIDLDYHSIKKLFSEMDSEVLELFQAVISEVKERGASMSDVQINELAKKYADKARKLAVHGGEECAS